ncbi:CinA family protein [Sphingomonadaceae bacterium jetA1]|uniref:CinA family protein n=1 Tax=Facivitalis istanbulensis TaxID=3075838 RepID=UPI003484B97D
MDTLLPEELIALADRVVRENRALGRRVALAESCTGGLVSAALTEIPVVFAQAVRDGDPEDMKAERHEFGDIGRGGIRLQAALLALGLLLP